MGLQKNEHGVWIVRHKVPVRLQQAVASVLDNGKERQVFLQESLRTKDKGEAKRLASPVLQRFNDTLAEAEAQLAERPLRTTLPQSEIDRIAECHFASVLASDDEMTRDGTGTEELVRSIAKQLIDADVAFAMPIPLDASLPQYGLSNRELTKRSIEIEDWAPIMRAALARGDISMVSETMGELLDRFRINLDRDSTAYRQLGMSVLKADVKALDARVRRYSGEPIDTPPMPLVAPKGAPVARGTLRAAFAGWAKEKAPAAGSLTEFERAIDLFIQLHGDMPIAQIKRTHARAFRVALQDVPRIRPAAIAALPLPELAEWGRAHPDAQKISNATVNKQFGGVRAIARWAMDDEEWVDPFSGKRLKEEEPDGGPFDPPALRTLFSSSVFTGGECSDAGRGDVAFWLPLLGLFTGARRSELVMLFASDIAQEETTGHWMLDIYEDKSKGKLLKTKGSARTIPIHSALVRMGFLRFVATMRSDGVDAWLFPAVSPERPGGAKAWTKWFRRYLNDLGITDRRKGLHSLRHNFTDALRMGSVPGDLNSALMGHIPNNVSGGYGHKVIGRRFGLPLFVEAIAKLQYPNLDLSGIHWEPGRATRPTKAKRKSRAA